jgi:type I restriction enzyme S subunit
MKQYESYKESGIEWLGQIPSHWNIVHIKNFFQVISGATPDSSNTNYWDGDIKWITPADFKTSDHFVSTGKRNITEEGYNSCGTSLVPAGSLIFSKRAPIGTVAISSNVLCTNQGCLSCVPFEKICYSPYYYYLFSVLTEAFEMLGSGSTFLEISANNFSNFPISAPPFKEQQTIAAYLDYKVSQIDAAITEKEQMLEDLKAYRSAIISEAVTKGLDKDVEMKDSGIDWLGMIPAKWDCSSLKRFLSQPLQYGANESAESTNPDWPRYIRITDIDEYGNLRDETFKSLDPEKANDYLLEKGDVLFARSGATVGKTYIFNENYAACFAGYLIKAKCGEKLLPEFLYLYTNSIQYDNWKNSVFIQATIQNIGADKYSLLPIVVPSIEEQQRILDYVNAKLCKLSSVITNVQSQIDDLKKYKSSIITEAVTGKVDLRDWKPYKK